MTRGTSRLAGLSDGVFAITITLLMVVAFLPFATSVLAKALRGGERERTGVVFYGITFAVTALTFNTAWQYALRRRLLKNAWLGDTFREGGREAAGWSLSQLPASSRPWSQAGRTECPRGLDSQVGLFPGDLRPNFAAPRDPVAHPGRAAQS